MDNDLETIKKILNTPIALRNSKMIQILMNLTKEFAFFENLISQLGEQLHSRICEFLNLEHREAESVLFSQGDKGDNFYILLDGKVKLLIYQKGSEDDTLTEIAQLSSGQSFGELSLIKNQPRNATVICMQSCFFMTLSKENYLRLLGKSMAKILENKIEFLHSLPLLNKWSKRSIEKLSYFFHIKTFKQNEVIYSADDPSDGAYVVINGQVELTTTNSSEKDLPRVLKVALIGEKDFFGDDEILKDKARSFKATCISKLLSCYFIKREDLLGKIDRESLKFLVKSNHLRNNLRETRLFSVRKICYTPIICDIDRRTVKGKLLAKSSKKKIGDRPNRNICMSEGLMKSIRQRSLAGINSPTSMILTHNSSVVKRTKSINTLFNMKGFQPRNLPAGIYQRIQERIRYYL